MTGSSNDPMMDPNTTLILGEVRGQLRELIHNTNNIQQGMTALGIRVAKLEEAENRRQGQISLVGALWNSRVAGWVAFLCAIVVGWFVRDKGL